jgi:hypothetical protein
LYPVFHQLHFTRIFLVLFHNGTLFSRLPFHLSSVYLCIWVPTAPYSLLHLRYSVFVLAL